MTSPYQLLPSVQKVLSDQRIQELVESYSHQGVLELVRAKLGDARSAISNGTEVPPFNEIIESIEEQASTRWRSWPTPVINATGVILHTNLGRAPLSTDAIEAMKRAAIGYSDLELDLETGRRGSRQAHISNLICQVSGAEAAMVVNNNASAVMLGLAAIATGKEVIVSRGEAVEIGGGFRIPDVLGQSGAKLVEVGTTNRTYARDYESAITENTGAFLAVHASNFRVVGFTHAPEIEELVALGKKHNIPVLHDLGSGCFLDTSQYGLAHEPMPQESFKAGVGLGFFSGDKLMGGPQAGIIAGDSDLVDIVSRHPLARAVRIDKLNMASLAATLLHYVKEESTTKVPIWRMISMSEDEVETKALHWEESLNSKVSVVKTLSAIGGGSLPGETLPSWAIAIDCADLEGGADSMAKRLRECDPPVIGRIEEERILLDPRTVLPEEEDSLLRIVSNVIS